MIDLDPELQLLEHDRYPLSSRQISTAHAHVSTQAQGAVYKDYLRISAIRTSSDRRLLKRESVAASAVHLHRLYLRSAPDNLAWDSINSDPIQVPDAPQTLSPRNAPQGRQTRSAPEFGFFSSSCLREASDCVLAFRSLCRLQ